MRFYFNINENCCADENWVIEYLLNNEEEVHDWEEAYEGLRTYHEFYGWYECEVSNTIEEKFEVQLIGY